MIDEKQARAKILENLRALPARTLPLRDALRAFSARDVFAGLSLPLFDNSSMDGYALRTEDAGAGVRLRVRGEQPAGFDRKLELKRGEAIRILTGAAMPAGANAVIMQEDTTLDGDFVILNEVVAMGENIRRRGIDVAEGQKIVNRGDCLRPQTLALLAAQGCGSIEVGGRVRAAIISTGDELAPPNAKLQPGQIYDSNSILLEAMLRESGVDVCSVTHCADRAEEIEAAVRAGLAADVMIVTGGVSVGARDFVKPALTAAGATLDLWRVAVKPGKPFLFGRQDGCAIFGLPGNPVSAFVTFLLFVRPALLKLMGANDEALALRETPAQLTDEIANPGDRPHYVRGILAKGVFTPVGRQESHALFGLSRANALVSAPPRTTLVAGANVSAQTWD